MAKAILRRLWWRIAGSPFERAELQRLKAKEYVPLMAIRAWETREREPASERIRRVHEEVSRELLELTRARHTAAILPMKKRESA